MGTDRHRIATEARRLLNDPAGRVAMSQQIIPLGDGRVGPRNAEIIDRWLEERLLARQQA
jgi:UDP-N-acetylglucosamine 2-epimerase